MSVSYRPRFERSADLVHNLTEASNLCSWINQQSIDVSWIARSQRDALIRLAHYSTRIEGNPLTLPEVEALASGKDLAVGERAKREVLNYFAALRWIWKSSPLLKINESDLLKLHATLTRGVLPAPEVGRYKTKPNAVFNQGRIVYKPPPPEAAPFLTQALLKWLNSREAGKEHPVVVAAIGHHRLVSIHPFMDGNGRIARSLETWVLFRRGFDTRHIFALDEFFDQDRARYYREIQEVRDREEDLTRWLEYVSEGIIAILEKTRTRIQTLRARKPEMKVTLSPGQERILQVLGQIPKLSGGQLAKAMDLSRGQLSKLLRPLIQTGLVAKQGSTKSAVYRLS